MPRLNRTDFGRIIVQDPDADRPIAEVATLQCCHCGGHWIPQPGSGRVRGYCTRCMGPVCGPGCKDCVPTDLMLENLEKGRPLDFRPVTVSLAAD